MSYRFVPIAALACILIASSSHAAPPIRSGTTPKGWTPAQFKASLGSLLETEFDTFLRTCPAHTDANPKASSIPAELLRESVLWTPAVSVPRDVGLRTYAAAFYTTPNQLHAFGDPKFRRDASSVTRDIRYSRVATNFLSYTTSCAQTLQANLSAGIDLPFTNANFKTRLASAGAAELVTFVGTLSTDLEDRLQAPGVNGYPGTRQWKDGHTSKTHEDLLSWYALHTDVGESLWFLSAIPVALVERSNSSQSSSGAAIQGRMGFQFGPAGLSSSVDASLSVAAGYYGSWSLEFALGAFNVAKPEQVIPDLKLLPLPTAKEVATRIAGMLQLVIDPPSGPRDFLWGAGNSVQGQLMYADGKPVGASLCEAGWKASPYGGTNVSVQAKVVEGQCRLTFTFDPVLNIASKNQIVGGQLVVASQLDPTSVKVASPFSIFLSADYTAQYVGTPTCTGGRCTVSALISSTNPLSPTDLARTTFDVEKLECEAGVGKIDPSGSRASFRQPLGTVSFQVDLDAAAICRVHGLLKVHRSSGGEIPVAFSPLKL